MYDELTNLPYSKKSYAEKKYMFFCGKRITKLDKELIKEMILNKEFILDEKKYWARHRFSYFKPWTWF